MIFLLMNWPPVLSQPPGAGGVQSFPEDGAEALGVGVAGEGWVSRRLGLTCYLS